MTDDAQDGAPVGTRPGDSARLDVDAVMAEADRLPRLLWLCTEVAASAAWQGRSHVMVAGVGQTARWLRAAAAVASAVTTASGATVTVVGEDLTPPVGAPDTPEQALCSRSGDPPVAPIAAAVIGLSAEDPLAVLRVSTDLLTPLVLVDIGPAPDVETVSDLVGSFNTDVRGRLLRHRPAGAASSRPPDDPVAVDHLLELVVVDEASTPDVDGPTR